MANTFNGEVFYTNVSQYNKFLSCLGEEHTFQTFDDKGKNKKLIKQLHGSIKQHFHELAQLNRQGAGVFFAVNETDLKGRATRHIKRVRSLFIDLDGTPLPEKFALSPHFIINTSPGKYHCYWLVKDMPLESFSLFQEALANKFNSDPKVKDLPRILRIPGFYWKKRKSYPVKIISSVSREPYNRNQIKVTLELERPVKEKIDITNYKSSYVGYRSAGITTKGDRHEKLIKMLISIRLRGESYEFAKNEAIVFNQNCRPPEKLAEIIFQLNDIWKRYVPT